MELVERYLATRTEVYEGDKMSGTVELKTDRLLLRRHQSEDAEILFEIFGCDPQMSEYSGWNPYQTRAMAIETVESFIKSYDDTYFYGWGIVYKGKLIGTIGAYDYDANKNWIEIGMSIARTLWGQGFATEALTVVLRYLTEHENIQTVSAWCASDNVGSRKVMEKAGMKMVRTDKRALEMNGQTYHKLIFDYTMR